MVKFDKHKPKQVPKICILEEDKICDNCCECFICKLNPTKICDNCAKCLELADYNIIPIAEIILSEKGNPDKGSNGQGNREG